MLLFWLNVLEAQSLKAKERKLHRSRSTRSGFFHWDRGEKLVFLKMSRRSAKPGYGTVWLCGWRAGDGRGVQTAEGLFCSVNFI